MTTFQKVVCGTGTKHKDDASNKSSSSDVTQMSARELGDDGSASGSKVKFPVRPGIIWRKGERLEAEDYQRNWYVIIFPDESKIVVQHIFCFCFLKSGRENLPPLCPSPPPLFPLPINNKKEKEQ